MRNLIARCSTQLKGRGLSTSTSTLPSSFEQLVGNTRLVRLRGASAETGCDIYAKCEFENPGGSVKDRPALWMVRAAESAGILQRGKPGLIVEGTAGNTGIGLALAGQAFGYDSLICLADTQSQEKKDLLRQAGAVLTEVPAVPFKDPNNYVHVAQRLAEAEEITRSYGGRVFYANQWDNLQNQRSHFESTGPEIWEQTAGGVDIFCCAMGTGGTLTGVGSFLREASGGRVQVCLTDPCGAVLNSYYTEGELISRGSSISEGIGQGRVTGNMAHGDFRPDACFEIEDAAMMDAIIQLQSEEGLAVGTSAGINVAGAIQVAREFGPGKTIVTVLCDKADRYATKLYNSDFLRAQGLRVPPWVSATDIEKRVDQLVPQLLA